MSLRPGNLAAICFGAAALFAFAGTELTGSESLGAYIFAGVAAAFGMQLVVAAFIVDAVERAAGLKVEPKSAPPSPPVGTAK